MFELICLALLFNLAAILQLLLDVFLCHLFVRDAELEVADLVLLYMVHLLSLFSSLQDFLQELLLLLT